MLCPACGTENADDAIACTACREVIDVELMDAIHDDTDNGLHTDPRGASFGTSPVPSDDDWAVSSHTRASPMGAVRQPTQAEAARTDVMLRSDAVLLLVEGTDPSTLSPFEQHIVAHLDGVRPIARVRKKTGLSGDDVRIAIGTLRDKQRLRLVGIFDPTLPAPTVAVELPPQPRPVAAPVPVDFAMEDEDTSQGVDMSAMEDAHGPTTDAVTDPAVSQAVIAELRETLGDDDDDPSPFDQ